MEILEAYGVPWQQLNTRAFLTPGQTTDGLTHAGLPVWPFDLSQAVRHAHLDFVVLPGPWENEVVDVLKCARASRVHAMRGAQRNVGQQSRLNGWWVKRSNGIWFWADRPAEAPGECPPLLVPRQPPAVLCPPIPKEPASLR